MENNDNLNEGILPPNDGGDQQQGQNNPCKY